MDKITLKDQVLDAQAILIDGRLVLSTGPFATVEAKVRRIGDFRGFEADLPLSGQVRLLDEAGLSYPIPENRQTRLYQALIPVNNPDFPIHPGRAYRLSVTIPDGRTFESAPEILIPAPKVEQLGFYLYDFSRIRPGGFVEALPYIGFQLSTPVRVQGLEGNARLRWEMTANYRLSDNGGRVCYLREPVRKEQVFIYNGAQFSNTRLDTLALEGTLLDFRFAEGCYISVLQESLSPGAFAYWQQIKTLTERTGNMFEAPAGRIRTNFSHAANPKDPVYGYFYACGQDTARLFIRPEQVGSPRRYCPVPSPRPTVCTNCLMEGVLEKPAFWIE